MDKNETETEIDPFAALAAKMIERLEGMTDTTTLTADQLSALIDDVSGSHRKEMIDEARAINQKANARIDELEAIEGKPMPEAVKNAVRRITNHDHIVAKRAQRMGLTPEEYQTKYPKGWEKMGKCQVSDEFENTVNSVDNGLAILVSEAQATHRVLLGVSAKLDVLTNLLDTNKLVKSAADKTVDIDDNVDQLHKLGVAYTANDIRKRLGMQPIAPTEFTSESFTPGHILADMVYLRRKLVAGRPNDNTELDYCFKVAIIDIDKMIAFFSMFCMSE